MDDKQLSSAARSDPLARKVRDDRRMAASRWNAAAAGADDQWSGHRVPHQATGVARDASGQIVWRGAVASGSMTPEQRAMPFPEGMNASHTEAKLVAQAQLPRGGTFRITGQFDPCTPCRARCARPRRTGLHGRVLVAGL